MQANRVIHIWSCSVDLLCNRKRMYYLPLLKLCMCYCALKVPLIHALSQSRVSPSCQSWLLTPTLPYKCNKNNLNIWETFINRVLSSTLVHVPSTGIEEAVFILYILQPATRGQCKWFGFTFWGAIISSIFINSVVVTYAAAGCCFWLWWLLCSHRVVRWPRADIHNGCSRWRCFWKPMLTVVKACESSHRFPWEQINLTQQHPKSIILIIFSSSRPVITLFLSLHRKVSALGAFSRMTRGDKFDLSNHSSKKKWQPQITYKWSFTLNYVFEVGQTDSFIELYSPVYNFNNMASVLCFVS